MDEFVLASCFHRLGKNGNAIMIIKDYDIFSAANRGHWETASLIGCNFPCELDSLGKYFVGAKTGCIRSSWRVSKMFGGANVLVILS